MANEIINLEKFQVSVKDFVNGKSNIEATAPKMFGDKIVFSLKGDKELTNLTIIPTTYPKGWIVEQGSVKKAKANSMNNVELHYEPSVWVPGSMTVFFVTEDGSSYGSRTFEMKRVGRIEEVWYEITKFLEGITSKIL